MWEDRNVRFVWRHCLLTNLMIGGCFYLKSSGLLLAINCPCLCLLGPVGCTPAIRNWNCYGTQPQYLVIDIPCDAFGICAYKSFLILYPKTKLILFVVLCENCESEVRCIWSSLWRLLGFHYYNIKFITILSVHFMNVHYLYGS